MNYAPPTAIGTPATPSCMPPSSLLSAVDEGPGGGGGGGTGQGSGPARDCDGEACLAPPPATDAPEVVRTGTCFTGSPVGGGGGGGAVAVPGRGPPTNPCAATASCVGAGCTEELTVSTACLHLPSVGKSPFDSSHC